MMKECIEKQILVTGTMADVLHVPKSPSPIFGNSLMCESVLQPTQKTKQAPDRSSSSPKWTLSEGFPCPTPSCFPVQNEFPTGHDMNYSCTVKQPVVRALLPKVKLDTKGEILIFAAESFAVEIEMVSFRTPPILVPGLWGWIMNENVDFLG